MPRQQELSDADAVSFLLQPDELSDEDAVAFLTAPEPQGGLPSPRPEPPQDFANPLPLAAFAGQALEGLSSLAGLGRIASEKLSGVFGEQQEAPFFSGLESGLKGLAEEAYPQAQRGAGGLMSETVPGVLGGIAATAPGIALGGPAAAISFGAQTGVPLYYEVKSKTGDEEAATWALLGGAAIGQLERFGAEKYLGGIISKLSKGKLGNAVKDAVLGWAIAGPQEAGTEAIQQGLSDLLQEELTGEELDKLRRMGEVIPPALIVGTGFGAIHSAVNRPAKQPAQAAPQAQQAQQAQPAAQEQISPPSASQEVQEPGMGVAAAEPIAQGQATGEPGMLPTAAATVPEVEVAAPEAAQEEGVTIPVRKLTARRLPHPPKENIIKPLTAYADRLYRETSIDRVFEMIDPGTDSQSSEFYWSNSKDLAIGQGHNRGVMLEIEAFPELEGYINKKPAWELAWLAGTAEFVTTNTLGKQIRPHVLSVTVQPEAAGQQWAITRLRGVLRSWSKTKNADGSVTYRPPGREAEREVTAAAEEAVPQAEPLRAKLEEDMAAPEIGTPEEAPEPSTEPEKATSIKNRVVERELNEMGLEPPAEVEKTTFREIYSKAKEKFDADQRSGERLVQDLESSPRAPSPEEDALLTFEANRLINEREDAQKAFVKSPTPENQARIDKAIADYEKTADVLKRAGRESALSLATRKMMMARDYSLAAMELSAKVAKGGQALTQQERARISDLHERLEAARIAHEKYVSEAEVKAAEQAAEIATLRLQKEAKGLGRKAKRKAEIEQAKKELGEILDELGKRTGKAAAGIGGIDAQTLALTAKAAAKAIQIGTKSFAQWADMMVARLGEGIRPYLQDAWKQGGKGLRADVLDKLDHDSPSEDIGLAAHKLALMAVESGITERTALVEAVHEDLKAAIPGITIEETRDAISGYGRFKPLAPGEAKAKLRELKGQLQQVAKLEALQEKEAIKKSGIERQKAGPEQTRLQKRVRAMQRFMALKPIDPGKAQAQALAATKSRMRSEINELESQIDAKQKKAKPGKVAEDAELRTLKDYREELKQQYDAMFPKANVKRVLTDAQRLDMAIKATARSLAEIEQRLKTGDLSRPTKRPGVSSKDLEALRAERDARKAELEFLRDANEPKKTPEEVALKAYKARKAREEAKLRQRITLKDFGELRPKKPQIKLDEQALKLQAEYEGTRRQFEREREKMRRATRTLGQKSADFAKEILDLPYDIFSAFDFSAVRRQGGFFTSGHPIKSAKIAKRMFKAFASPQTALEADVEVRGRWEKNGAKEAGVELTSMEGELGPREEIIRSRLGHLVPGVKASQRAFVTYLNLQRVTVFESIKRGMPEPSKQDLEHIAELVNVATGRAVGKGKSVAQVLGATRIFWAPGYVVSRFQLGVSIPLKLLTSRKMSWKARKAIGKQYARYVAGTGSYYALVGYMLAMLADEIGEEFEVGTELNSDLGKIRIGNVRLDPLSGLAQVGVFLARMVTGETKTLKGEVKKLGEAKSEYDPSYGSVALRFVRTKFAPVPGYVWDAFFGKTFEGEKFESTSIPGRLVEAVKRNPPHPLAPGDIYEAMKELGVPASVILGVFSLLGDGLQTYGEQPKERAR